MRRLFREALRQWRMAFCAHAWKVDTTIENPDDPMEVAVFYKCKHCPAVRALYEFNPYYVRKRVARDDE